MKSSISKPKIILFAGILLFISPALMASSGVMPAVFGIRIEFILFALALIGVAIFHHKTMYVALTGLAAILAVKYIFTDFSLVQHIVGTAIKEG
jgi:hypothetical protein